MKRIKVIIAEDHKILRETITNHLNDPSSRIQVIGAVEDGLQLIAQIKQKRPHVILLDLSMPIINGWEILQILRDRFPNIKPIVYSGDFEEGTVAHAVAEGALAFIGKWNAGTGDIVSAIENVFDHGYFYNEIMSREVARRVKTTKRLGSAKRSQSFTEREREILKLICDGQNDKEIAEYLHIAPRTVKHHKNNLYKKTKTKSTVAVLKYAISKGIYNVTGINFAFNREQ